MKKLIAALGMICLLPLTLLSISQTAAQAATCGDVQHRSSAVSTGNDNLLIAGRPITFKLHMDQKDCPGYDLITEVWATIHKDGGNCKNIWATTTAYRVNPNVIGDANPGEKSVDCVGDLTGGQTDYTIRWDVYETISSDMPESDRCLAMTGHVALRLQTDPGDFKTPSMCVNGA